MHVTWCGVHAECGVQTGEGEGREGGEGQRKKVRKEEGRDNFKFFLLLGTQRVISLFLCVRLLSMEDSTGRQITRG